MNNELYWIERVREANAKILTQTEKEIQERLITAYKKAYKEIISGEIFEIMQEYSDNNGEISLTKLLKYNRLKKMTEKFKDIVEELGGEEINFLNRSLPEIYKEAGGSASKGVGVEIDWSIVPKEQINRAVNYPWSGEHYSDRIWENKRKLVRNLSETVTQGIIQGKSISDMMKDLQDKMEKGAYECRRIVRTETMHMVNAGAIDRYKAAGVTELEYVMSQDYYSNGKPRYCQTCAEDKGKIFPIDNAPILPRHPNCRCTYVPVIETMIGPKKSGEEKKEKEYKEYDKRSLNKHSIGRENLSDEDYKIYRRYVANGNSFEMNRKLYTKEYEKYLSKVKEIINERLEMPRYTAEKIQGAVNRKLAALDPNDYSGIKKVMEWAEEQSKLKKYTKEQILKYIEEEKPQWVKDIEDFSGLIGSCKIPYDIKCVRFSGEDFLTSIGEQLQSDFVKNITYGHYDEFSKNIKDINAQLSGSIYENKAFTSVSYSESKNVFTGYGVKMNVMVDKGTAGIITQNWEESELVLQAGTKFEILGVEDDPKNRKIIMNVRAFTE